MTLGEIAAILSDIRFNGWTFRVALNAGNPYLQVRAKTVNNHGEGEIEWGGRKWLLSHHMTRSEIVTTAFKAVMTAVEHETREQFLYRGVSIFDPHYDVDQLYELRSTNTYLDVRPEPMNLCR